MLKKTDKWRSGTTIRKSIQIALCFLLLFTSSANAFLEDICQKRKGQGITYCIQPTCPPQFSVNRACPRQVAEFAAIMPGRSMVHADSTYFIAQALGYRADVAYWIAAYNEVTDYGLYKPIDQCGIEASAQNSGRSYMAAQFNGFVRTNANTDGPLDHYTVSYSPNGQGTDVHGAGGVEALYPLHYPQPGYPVNIDDTYQKTLANARQWAMLPSRDPGLLCTVGLTSSDGTSCLTGTIKGTVPLIMKSTKGVPINVPAGRKVLDYDTTTKTSVYYEKLGSYLNDKQKTIGTLWKDPVPVPVPVQVARMGLWLHILQDTSSHATYCGDDAPSPPGGSDIGTYMFTDPADPTTFNVLFGSSCATSPHLAGHVQETGTGDNPLPLRDYVALNNTVDELINFGNQVALKHPGWIVNPELLPPNVVGGINGQGLNAADLKTELVGKIVQGTAYSSAEVYRSGVVTLPLQVKDPLERLHAMNRALGDYSATVGSRWTRPVTFTAFEPMPGNSFDPKNTSVCWRK
jgi:hypothetical protein